MPANECRFNSFSLLALFWSLPPPEGNIDSFAAKSYTTSTS